jgi:VCBS repeat-containing protein
LVTKRYSKAKKIRERFQVRAKKWVLPIVLVAVLTGEAGAPSALAANASISGTNSASYTEGASSIAPFASVTVGGGPFDGSFVDFEVVDASGNPITGGGDSDALDDLTLSDSGAVVNTSGVVSVVGGTVYVGRGSSAEAVGEIDGTYDGQNGTKLRVNFSTTFENSGFESGAVSPWTVLGQRIDMGTTQILGYTTPADSTLNYPTNCSSQGTNDNDVPDAGASYSHQIVSDQKNSGTYSLRLFSSLNTRFGGDVVHGPAAYSVEFDGTAGQSLSFAWRAANGGDNHHVWGGLLATDSSLPGGGQRWTELLDPGTGTSTNWATASGSIPHTGKFRFVFISGTHDYSCGEAAGASLYIDDVTITGSSAIASVVSQVAPFVSYSSTDDSPPATRYVKMTATPKVGSPASTTSTISVTAVNDPPQVNIDSAGAGVTKTEAVNEARFSMPSVTGTLAGVDPDLDSPTFTFGITGGSTSGDAVTKVGDYGTLTVDNTSDAYTYVPNLNAIESLNTGENATDSFTISVSDGQASGTGTLTFTINGFTDSVASLDGSGTPASGGVNLTWSAPTDDGVNTLTGYVIEARPKGTSTFATVSDTDGNATNAAASITGLDPCVAYDFRIKGVFDNGTGSASSTTTVTAFGTTGLTPYSASAFVETGDASRSGGVITLTPDAGAKAGALWSGTRFDLRESFCVSAEVKLSDVVRTATASAGADGIAFVLQPADTSSLSAGGGLGYSPSIDPSVAVEFDTYLNSDVAQQEIAVRKVSGASNSAWAAGTSGVDVTSYNIEDGEFHQTEIRYDADQELLTVLFDFNSDGDFSDTGEVVFENIEESLDDFFSGTNFAYWGFTAATGGATNLQQVRNIAYSPGSLAANTNPSATNPGAQSVAVGATSTVNVTLNDNSETTQDQWRLSVASGNTGFATATVSATSATNAEITVTGVANGDTTLTLTALDADGASVTVAFAVRSGTGSPVVSGGGGETAAPQPTVTLPQVNPRVLPRLLLAPPIQSGPVLRGNVPPAPPAAPTATVGGRSTPIQTQVTSPTGFSLTAGVLNLGLQVQQDQGVVRQNNTGGTEIEVKKGSTAAVSGTGFLPRSTVQVFLPLQGTNAKEIARIPVDEAGTFSGDAVFATRVNERSLPIGKQVLQVVSLDEDGQQSVVEMTVNIAQSAPAPEPDRTVGATPTLRPGQFLATNAGEPEIVTVVPVPEDRQARVEGDGWQMSVDIPSANGSVARSDEGGAVLQLVRDETAVVSGTGFMPGTRADVWLFSEPTLLGTVDIDENGEFTGEVNIDSNVVVVGEHTLQLQGVGEDGYVRAANLGVVVNDTAAEATTEEAAGGFLWWLWLLVILVALVVWFAVWRYRRSREA